MVTKFIFWYLSHRYKKLEGLPVMYIDGTGKDFPKYLLYTEDEKVRKRMENF